MSPQHWGQTGWCGEGAGPGCSLSVSLSLQAQADASRPPCLEGLLPPGLVPPPSYPTLNTEHSQASENDQHSTFSPWPRGLCACRLLPTGGPALRNTLQPAAHPPAPSQQPPKRGCFLCHLRPLPTVGAPEQARKSVSILPPDTPKQQVLPRNDPETRKAWSLPKEVSGSWPGFLTNPIAITLELEPSRCCCHHKSPTRPTP